MKTKRRWPWYLLIFVLLLAGIIVFFPYSSLNDFQKDGTLKLAGLNAPVEVVRDEKGMAYVYAKSQDDAIMAQGFVAAQDRLFQMELTRLFASGRICELAGAAAKNLDIRNRTLGFYRMAKRHAKILSPDARRFFQKYVDGVNAYIKTRADTHHLEFKLAGIKPTPWEIADSMAILYYMSWDTSANVATEGVTQMLVEKLGLKKAREIFPLNINPDDKDQSAETKKMIAAASGLEILTDKTLLGYFKNGPIRLGSNNWTVGAKMAAGPKPIVANDPHLDARILPGPWYPIGLIGPGFRAVGVNIAGIPGMVAGRNEHMAIGVTNAYGDVQDLYVETLDPAKPGHYLEGNRSIPFTLIKEILRIKDKAVEAGYREEKIQIKRTKRGPVISGLVSGLKTKKVITARFAPYENMQPEIGLDKILTAKSVADVRKALSDVRNIVLNFVFADTAGSIAWQVSGRLPIRTQGQSIVPYVVKSGKDNWTGWIPFEAMPHKINPPKGWLGTCNHYTVDKNYPYYYTSYASHSYRYRRLKELMKTQGKKTAADLYKYQRDTKNMMASVLAPIMAKALMAQPDTRKMGEILSKWDHHDDIDKAAPTIFQAVYKTFALKVFEDELGTDLAKFYLNNWYVWTERLAKMVEDGNSSWFDNTATKDVIETRDMLFQQAAVTATVEFKEKLGSDPHKWLWGDVHQLELVSPIRRKGFGKGLVGGGSHPFPGSGETLYRGWYDFDKPFGVTHSAALRMVADLNDADKVMAVLPAGVAGRTLNPRTTNQIEAYMKGQNLYWWFSDKAIAENAKHRLKLVP
jgi:penicillin G amidase